MRSTFKIRKITYDFVIKAELNLICSCSLLKFRLIGRGIKTGSLLLRLLEQV